MSIYGIGSLAGITHNVFDIFNPRQLNPVILAVHASVIAIYIAGVRWLYFKNGAEFLEQHPGILQMRGLGGKFEPSAKQIKIFFALGIIGMSVVETFMWLGFFVTPVVK